jgi:hypothetical protein
MTRDDGMRPNMAFLLMAQYSGAAVIPLQFVVRDYFRHLTEAKHLQKILRGAIRLPIVRIERSQKAARGVALIDLANYLEKQRALAVKELAQLNEG